MTRTRALALALAIALASLGGGCVREVDLSRRHDASLFDSSPDSWIPPPPDANIVPDAAIPVDAH